MYSGKFRSIKQISPLKKIYAARTFVRFLGMHHDDFSKRDEKEYGEFSKFIHNYAIYFNHYYFHAAHRLEEINEGYAKMAKQFIYEYNRYGDSMINTAGSSDIMYNFEDYLTAIRSSLDVLTKICLPAYRQSMPRTYNDFCRSKELSGPHLLFKNASNEWANKLIAYRDHCIHYSPFDNLPSKAELIKNGRYWEVFVRIPDNPEARSTSKFTYNDNIDILKYSIDTFSKYRNFEDSVSWELYSLYKKGQYPIKYKKIVTV